MFDIYTAIELPIWLVLLVQSTGLPWLQGLITKANADSTTHKAVTVGLGVVAAILMLIAGDMFSIANVLMLGAPGVFISSNSYDKFWKIFRINDFLAPAAGIGTDTSGPFDFDEVNLEDEPF